MRRRTTNLQAAQLVHAEDTPTHNIIHVRVGVAIESRVIDNQRVAVVAVAHDQHEVMTMHDVGDDDRWHFGVDQLLNFLKGDVVAEVHSRGGPCNATRADEWDLRLHESRAAWDVSTVLLEPAVDGGWTGGLVVDLDTGASKGHGDGGHEATNLADGVIVSAHDGGAPGGVALLVHGVDIDLEADDVRDVGVWILSLVEAWVVNLE